MFEIRISVGVCGSGAISCVTVRPEQMERHFECFLILQELQRVRQRKESKLVIMGWSRY